jgi:penicillin-binding protein 1C
MLSTIRFSKVKIIGVSALLISLLFFLLSKPNFQPFYSTVLYASDGTLLAATIAQDQQYRFPPSNSIPEKFKVCIIEFEDKYFFRHFGINPVSVSRAMWNNIKAGKIVQGGSTITQQVIRLSREGKRRTFFEKIIEALHALRLEATKKKSEILLMYASNAPFGGNVVGLEAAAWRYYGRCAEDLSWAETASLAVLPNSPALVHPGRNPEALLAKRNRLLKHLFSRNYFDELTLELSLQEPLPSEPKPLPQLTPHLLFRSIADGHGGTNLQTTINSNLQKRVIEVLERHHQRLSGNQIHNAAVLVLNIKKGTVETYVGNTKGDDFGNHVDIISSARSTGSILKPFLYALMLNEGLILPNTLIPDVPTQIGGYSPKNFNPIYDGAVPAKRAISRSLNVPAVRMIQQYGVERFHYQLKRLGLTTINRSPENYGLSLILGGAEATLYDLAGVYAGMARSLNDFRTHQSRYDSNNFSEASYIQVKGGVAKPNLVAQNLLNAAAIYHCFEAMKEVSRPDELVGWQYFSSSRSVAWKTGTSYGHRDAWAIGLNPSYVVAVWAGNASGEGRPNLTGISAAAPILFDVFGLLPPSSWFEKPIDDMAFVPICRQSGHRASAICEPIDSIWIPLKGTETSACPYHRIVHLNKQQTQRVTDRCYSVSEMVAKPWFVLPPAMEWFYKSKNTTYMLLPRYKKDCESHLDANPMALLYPRIENSKLVIPRDFDGNRTEVIFDLAHSADNAVVFWHLNDQYLGQTIAFHKMALSPPAGKHTLTLVDTQGNTLVVNFRVD